MTTLTQRHAVPDVAERPRHRQRSRAGLVCWILVAASLTCWLLSLPSVRSAQLSQYGLLATASPLFSVAIILDAIAFIACIRGRQFAAGVTAVLSMIAIQRLTTTIVTAVPIYSWTYKHLGAVNYIQEHGRLAHGLDVYQGWPGLFAVTAWFSEVTGVDPVTLAHWFTPAVHVALAGLIYAAARAWKLDQYASLTAAFLVEALNWVGQDYYSPQATALLLAVGFILVLGLCQDDTRFVPLALVLFAATVVTHQLTPYWLLLAGIGLTVTKRIRSRWLLPAMFAIALSFFAFNYDSVSHFSLFSLNPVSNAQSNVPTVGVLGQRVTSLVVRLLSVTMWIGTMLAVIYGRLRREPVLGRLILAFSSFVLLGGQGYGGEAIFRVFLYSLVGCSFLLAPMLTRLLRASITRAGLVSIVLVGTVGASAQGFFGGWFANRMPKAQVTEAQQLLNSVPIPGYITVAAPVWPERPTGRYVDFVEATTPGDQTYDYPLIYQAKLTGANFVSDAQYDTFIKTAGERTSPTYLIVTRQMAIYDWYFGILPLDSLDNLSRRLRADPRWTVYKNTKDYTVFKSTPALVGAK